MNKRDLLIITLALRYMRANLSDVNWAFCAFDDTLPAETIELNGEKHPFIDNYEIEHVISQFEIPAMANQP